MSEFAPELDSPRRPAVGVAVIVRREGRLLLGRRRSRRGYGYWSAPGGHLEGGEGFVECAIRETLEEAGIEFTGVRLATVTNDIIDESREHYVSVIMVADYLRGTAKVLERKNFFRWGWYAWGTLPAPLSPCLSELADRGFDPFGRDLATQLEFPWILDRGRLKRVDLKSVPGDEESVVRWLESNGYGHVATAIVEIRQEWRRTGKKTRRNWWAVLAGDSKGRPRTVAGRQFPVIREAQFRQGSLRL